MGGRNTGSKHKRRKFKSKSFAKLESKKRLLCLGLIDHNPGDRSFRKVLWNQTIKEVLHRPFEPAGLIGRVPVPETFGS